ncbi:MAG: SWIM zinc finger domain-containing protein, partial [Anaerolineae bacterium]|nr:SWIM zinc finger domain-containing protein [Anaerolineae bacterium]
MAEDRPKDDFFRELTWEDLEEWAGVTIVSRGQGYHRNRRVQDLARTPSGGIIAWVQGTQRYATLVDVQNGDLVATCTCPYWATCKHAVAVVLEYLDRLKQKAEVPTVTDEDPRRAWLAGATEPAGDEWQEEEAEDDEEWEEAGEDSEADDIPSRKSGKSSGGSWRSYLAGQTRDQLISLLEELAARHPDVRQNLQDRSELATGTARRLVSSVEAELDRLSAEINWRNDWDEGGYVADYSRVRDRLEVLLAKGYADQVVALGEKLIAAGNRQVEMVHDEGELVGEITTCMGAVFRGLVQSSLSPAKQMLWAVEAELQDDYDFCQGAVVVWAQEYPAAEWNVLAEMLIERLASFRSARGEDDYSGNYRRDHLSNRLIMALEKAGRGVEIIPLCEREAEETGSYLRLVNYLQKEGRWAEAEAWIRKGIETTRARWPGISDQLRTALREMREKEGNWLEVAAIWAEDFFRQPSLGTFQALQKAAEQAGVWHSVRAAAMDFLRFGKVPRAPDPAWPLPDTGEKGESPHWPLRFPLVSVLIDIAL